MSVLACDRVNCEAIMCDRLILEGSAYICDECWKELLEHKKTWPEGMTIDDVRIRIVTFMASEPRSLVPASPEDIEQEFKRLTER